MKKDIRKIFSIAMMGMAVLSFSSCDGILDDIYDDPVETSEDDSQGGITTDDSSNRGQLYIDATDYYSWIYFDINTLTLDTLTIDLDADDPLADEPESWTLAFHRWDVRTNGGAGLETEYTSLDDLEASGVIPEGEYVEDEWYEYVSVDMSGMMSGNIGYMSCYVNLEIGKWMDVSTSTMPPTYTPSGKVYMLRLSDGTYMALILSNYLNSSGSKGYLTIDYIYPYQVGSIISE